jgi:RNA polymerase sigma-70 factor, ECF subfamily
VNIVDTASQPGDLVLPALAEHEDAPLTTASTLLAGLPPALSHELWATAEAHTCDLTEEEFATILTTIGTKHNYGAPPATHPDAAQKIAFLRSLRLPELALAQACALGREPAWQRFIDTYRASLTQAAIAITGSATLGHDLADSLYSELYGLREQAGERRSPLASYSGRGSLLGWLRTTLAQRHVDHHRRTHRETPLDTLDAPAPTPTTPPNSAELQHLTHAVARTLQTLPSEDRFLLSSYFLDRQTLLQISRILNVHEATISRRLKRLTSDLRKQLLHNLQSGGLSQRAAEEALGNDPRDLEINLRTLLQTSQADTFSNKTSATTATKLNQP